MAVIPGRRSGVCLNFAQSLQIAGRSRHRAGNFDPFFAFTSSRFVCFVKKLDLAKTSLVVFSSVVDGKKLIKYLLKDYRYANSHTRFNRKNRKNHN